MTVNFATGRRHKGHRYMTVNFTTGSRDEGHKHMTVSTFTTEIRVEGHKSNAAHARQSLQYVYTCLFPGMAASMRDCLCVRRSCRWSHPGAVWTV